MQNLKEYRGPRLSYHWEYSSCRSSVTSYSQHCNYVYRWVWGSNSQPPPQQELSCDKGGKKQKQKPSVLNRCKISQLCNLIPETKNTHRLSESLIHVPSPWFLTHLHRWSLWQCSASVLTEVCYRPVIAALGFMRNQKVFPVAHRSNHAENSVSSSYILSSFAFHFIVVCAAKSTHYA
jgi:hypothetical protein